MEKKIQVHFERDGQPVTDELSIRFNMAVEIAYEDITGEPFDLMTISKSKKNLLSLYSAVIITCNKDSKVTTDDLLFNLDGEELTKIDAAISECMRDWLHLPLVMQNTSEQEGDPEKK